MTRQMRDERGTLRNIEKRERQRALMELIFWMGELQYILLYLSNFFFFSSFGNNESIKHLRRCWGSISQLP